MNIRLDDLIRSMSDPATYPHHPESVQVVQTHISVVFIAGDLVYKIKKPLDFGFLDFTTLEKRRHFCRQEVDLNSRFSDDIYLGVVPIHQAGTDINLTGEGREVEAAVLMKRIPQACVLKIMLEEDRVTPQILDRIGDRLAFFHSRAAAGPMIASFGTVEVITHNLRENFDQTAPFIGRTLDKETHEAISTAAFTYLESHRDLIRERMIKGFVRDCHGDLHLDHVVIRDDIVLVDCIEFNDRFRYGDTASDLAFLLMDFDFRGFPAFGTRVAQRYAAASGDRDVLKLLGFYKSYRAFVRGKVHSFSLDEEEILESERSLAREKARTYFQLALAALKPSPPPTLIVMSGLSGSGKSYLASRLGMRLGIEPTRSDVVRKEIMGVPVDEHQLDMYGQGIYTPIATEQTYRVLMERARESLVRGESVILDASFTRRRERTTARELAREAGARFRIIECVAPDNVARERLDARIARGSDPSDGRWEIFRQQKLQTEEIQPEERENHWQWDSTSDVNMFLTSLVRDLLFH